MIVFERSSTFQQEIELMLSREEIDKTILIALQNVNEERAPGERFSFGSDSKLFGIGSPIDSLSLVSLIVDVETSLTTLVGRPVELMDDRAMTRKESPFKSVQTLTEYILELLNESAL